MKSNHHLRRPLISSDHESGRWARISYAGRSSALEKEVPNAFEGIATTGLR